MKPGKIEQARSTWLPLLVYSSKFSKGAREVASTLASCRKGQFVLQKRSVFEANRYVCSLCLNKIWASFKIIKITWKIAEETWENQGFLSVRSLVNVLTRMLDEFVLGIVFKCFGRVVSRENFCSGFCIKLNLVLSHFGWVGGPKKNCWDGRGGVLATSNHSLSRRD